jgi:SAM-dependent methyltransferase
MNDLRDTVRERYSAAVTSVSRGLAADDVTESACCDPADGYGLKFYDITERGALPDAAVLASLGCGNPTAVAELQPGERVLDLGSGGGIDVILSARRVGPSGRAFGLDMTDEMLDLAARNATEAGVTNVEFVRGTIENVPLPSASIDVVISNCVINLAADKAAVFREIGRVLRPGGRVGVSDVVADDTLTPAQRAERGSFAGCIAGALSFSEYRSGLAAVGLVDIEIVPTHTVGDGLHAAIVRATKPAQAAIDLPAMPTLPTPLNVLGDAAGCGCGAGGCC